MHSCVTAKCEPLQWVTFFGMMCDNVWWWCCMYMALYAQVHLCAMSLYTWIASPVWFVIYVSEGIRAYCTLPLVDAYVFEYTAMCAVLRWLFSGMWLIPHSTHVVWFAAHVQYTSVIMWVYRVLRVAGMHYLVLLSHVCTTKCWLSTMRNIYIVGNLSDLCKT